MASKNIHFIAAVLFTFVLASTAEAKSSVFLQPSGVVLGRKLSETAEIDRENLVVCSVIENSGKESIFITSGIRSQIGLVFGQKNGERLINENPRLPGPIVSAPMPNEDRSFFFLESGESIKLCQKYLIKDINYNVFIVQSKFKSWLSMDNLSAPITKKLIENDVILRPLYSNEEVYSNLCEINLRLRMASCGAK